MGAISEVTGLMQACINGVRAAGATSQYIFVEGTSYSGAWTWFVPFLLYLLNLALMEQQGVSWKRCALCPY
jgi:hypothetical protein